MPAQTPNGWRWTEANPFGGKSKCWPCSIEINPA